MTLLVRVFIPAAAGETPFAGVVEQVGTSWSTCFSTEEELLAAVRSCLDRTTQAPSTQITGSWSR